MIPKTCSVVEDESLTERNLQVFISPRIKLMEWNQVYYTERVQNLSVFSEINFQLVSKPYRY